MSGIACVTSAGSRRRYVGDSNPTGLEAGDGCVNEAANIRI